MQIIHEDVFGNLASLSILFEIGVKDNQFLQQLGFGVDDPDIALKLRGNEVLTLVPKPSLNLGRVNYFLF
jgi:hypothetical protein